MDRKIRFGVLGYASIAKREVIPALIDPVPEEEHRHRWHLPGRG